jgi:hypothetical protein
MNENDQKTTAEDPRYVYQPVAPIVVTSFGRVGIMGLVMSNTSMACFQSHMVMEKIV